MANLAEDSKLLNYRFRHSAPRGIGSSALAIFCRAPRLGSVKTRLAQTRGEEFALQLYCAMLADTFALGRALSPEIETFACFTPEGVGSTNSLADLWDGPSMAQCEGDLGVKILDCFARLRTWGYERILVIGSDSPDLPVEQLRAAAKELQSHETVIGESSDGGFYLLGSAVALDPSIFEGIVWSSENVFRRLLRNIDGKMALAQLLPWHDVDDENGLEQLEYRIFKTGTHAPQTRRFLDLAQRHSPKA